MLTHSVAVIVASVTLIVCVVLAIVFLVVRRRSEALAKIVWRRSSRDDRDWADRGLHRHCNVIREKPDLSRVLADAVTGQGLDLTDSAGASAAFIVDGIGDQVGALTDTGANAFQAAWDPCGTGGATTGTSSPFWTQNPYGYKTGNRTAAAQISLTKFGQRWYLATVGAWTQQDTLDAPLDPSNANRYAYVADAPLLVTDPTGSEVIAPFYDATGVIGGVGGLVAEAAGAAAIGVAIGCFEYDFASQVDWAANPELLVAVSGGY